jgi:hypothetical protein
MIKLTKILAEANISYTPEKIDEFIVTATKALSVGKRLFDSYVFEIADMNISNILSDPGGANQLLNKIRGVEQSLGKQHSMYFNIIDTFDVSNLPSNVRELEKLTDEIDNVYFDMGKIADALEYLINAADKFKEFI